MQCLSEDLDRNVLGKIFSAVQQNLANIVRKIRHNIEFSHLKWADSNLCRLQFHEAIREAAKKVPFLVARH